jgi:hypothetical protein
MLAAVEAYQNAGVEHLVLALNTGEVDAIRSLMETIATQVLPRFR